MILIILETPKSTRQWLAPVNDCTIVIRTQTWAGWQEQQQQEECELNSKETVGSADLAHPYLCHLIDDLAYPYLISHLWACRLIIAIATAISGSWKALISVVQDGGIKQLVRNKWYTAPSVERYLQQKKRGQVFHKVGWSDHLSYRDLPGQDLHYMYTSRTPGIWSHCSTHLCVWFSCKMPQQLHRQTENGGTPVWQDIHQHNTWHLSTITLVGITKSLH